MSTRSGSCGDALLELTIDDVAQEATSFHLNSLTTDARVKFFDDAGAVIFDQTYPAPYHGIVDLLPEQRPKLRSTYERNGVPVFSLPYRFGSP